MSSSLSKIQGYALAIAAGAFLIACATPALVFHKMFAGGNPSTMYGFWCLIMGPLGLFWIQPAWLANIFIPVGWFLLLTREYRGSMFWSALAIGFALSTFALFGTEVLADEAGGKMRLHTLHVGYWLWLLCPVAVFAGAWQCNLLTTQAAQDDDDIEEEED